MTGTSIDVAKLSRWLDAQLGQGGELRVSPLLQGGASNEVYGVERGEERWVLRKPPSSSAHASAHDVLREYRFISALAPTAARVPKPVIACADTEVIGSPFYLMEQVAGVPVRYELPQAFRGDLGEQARIGYELIDALVEIHGVDYRAAGLAEVGKPEGYLERQPQRWRKQLESYRVRDLPHIDELYEYLSQHVPKAGAPAIVHGDYKTDNVLYALDRPARILAVVDWELATIGDPLVDLAWALLFWPERPLLTGMLGSPGKPNGFLLDGLPTCADLVRRYAQRTGRDVSRLAYYTALAGYKLAIIIEGNYARYKKGLSDHPMHAHFEVLVPEVLSRAAQAARTERDGSTAGFVS